MLCDARPCVNFHYAQDGVLGCLAGEKSTGFFTRHRFNVELEWPEIFFWSLSTISSCVGTLRFCSSSVVSSWVGTPCLWSLPNNVLDLDTLFLESFRNQFQGWDTLFLESLCSQFLG